MLEEDGNRNRNSKKQKPLPMACNPQIFGVLAEYLSQQMKEDNNTEVFPRNLARTMAAITCVSKEAKGILASDLATLKSRRDAADEKLRGLIAAMRDDIQDGDIPDSGGEEGVFVELADEERALLKRSLDEELHTSVMGALNDGATPDLESRNKLMIYFKSSEAVIEWLVANPRLADVPERYLVVDADGRTWDARLLREWMRRRDVWCSMVCPIEDGGDGEWYLGCDELEMAQRVAEQWTPAGNAVRDGNFREVDRMLREDRMDPDSICCHIGRPRTLLSVACEHGHLNIVTRLLEAGAHPGTIRVRWCMHRSSTRRSDSKYIVSEEARRLEDVRSWGQWKRHLLYEEFWYCRDVRDPGVFEGSSLDDAMWHAINGGHNEIVACLLKAGFPVDANIDPNAWLPYSRDDDVDSEDMAWYFEGYFYTSFLFAALKKNLFIMQLLVNTYSANINLLRRHAFLPSMKQTALMAALTECHTRDKLDAEVVRYLVLGLGVDVNVNDGMDNTWDGMYYFSNGGEESVYRERLNALDYAFLGASRFDTQMSFINGNRPPHGLDDIVPLLLAAGQYADGELRRVLEVVFEVEVDLVKWQQGSVGYVAYSLLKRVCDQRKCK